jgi:hypothetical protein
LIVALLFAFQDNSVAWAQTQAQVITDTNQPMINWSKCISSPVLLKPDDGHPRIRRDLKWPKTTSPLFF